jgi:hypothetical protein
MHGVRCSLCKNTLLVIPKPALSARNLFAASSDTADSSRDNLALRNDNPLGIFQTAPLPMHGWCRPSGLHIDCCDNRASARELPQRLKPRLNSAIKCSAEALLHPKPTARTKIKICSIHNQGIREFQDEPLPGAATVSDPSSVPKVRWNSPDCADRSGRRWGARGGRSGD